ncbi:AraC family transcriptional regulator [Bacillaceae bacterium SIJ1]|uniref:AraC family transcriptional regulator n=1 Tax=Litoribacterium kuwaitense TaxID=1398745 RepID=UPI0013EB51B1|nr:AraC family transcriptional regulator [Litoribacterium kuwaitense]NGP45719.1 AraC family transcriptional regulator [Litoribacterium kuwaitense]
MSNCGASISMLYPLVKSLKQGGYDLKLFWSEAVFDDRLLQDAEARIPEEELERLMQLAADYTEDDFFGLRQGCLLDVADMGAVGYMMMHSGTVLDALKTYQRYNRILCSGFQLDWVVMGEDVKLRMFFQDESKHMSRHCAEDMASALYQLLLKMTNQVIHLRGVSFMHASPHEVKPYQDIFGQVPRFQASENALMFSKKILNEPILYANAKLKATFEQIAADVLKRLLQGQTFADQVTQWIAARMPKHLPTLQETGAAFQLSTRSLQVKLQAEGTTYNALTAALRKESAVEYLRRSEYTVGEIAYLLHYSEPSAFQTAFRKWMGISPGQYRDLQRDQK